MKIPGLILLSMVSFVMHAQVPTETRARWTFGINASADYGFRTLINKDGSEMSAAIIADRNKHEQPHLGFSTGLNANYRLTEHLALMTGLQFCDKSYSYYLDDLTYGDLIDPRKGFIYGGDVTGIRSIEYVYHQYYLDIFLGAHFNFGNRRLRPTLSAGMAYNILLKADRTRIFTRENGDKDRESVGKNENFKPFGLTPFISAGVQYYLTEKTEIRIEPIARYGLLEITDTPITARLWNAGINFSVYRSF